MIQIARVPPQLQDWVHQNQGLVRIALYALGGAAALYVWGLIFRPRARGGRPLKLDTVRKKRKYARKIAGRGEYLQAGDIMMQAGEYPQALDYYLAGKAFVPAAKLCEKIGKHAQAAQHYERAESWGAAGKNYEKAQRYQEAESCYLKAFRLISIAEMYDRIGRHDRAAQYYEKTGKMGHASMLWERAGNLQKAAELGEAVFRNSLARQGQIAGRKTQEKLREDADRVAYLYASTGRFQQASDIYALAGMRREAAQVLENGGDYLRAAGMYGECGEHLKASECYGRAGDVTNSEIHRAHAWASQGIKLEEAAGIFDKYRLFQKAGQIYSRLERHGRAGKAYEKAGKLPFAVRSFERAGAMTDAARLHMAMGDYERAADCALAANDHNLAVQAYTQANQYYHAGKLLWEQGDPDRALPLLQKLQPSDPCYGKTQRLIADIFLANGMYGPAKQQYQLLLGDGPVTADNLDVAYHLAIVHQHEGDHAQAVRLLELVIGVDFSYRDAADRLKELAKPSRPEAASVPDRKDDDAVELVMCRQFHSESIVGLEIGGCRIMEKIGSGGMGTVFKAKHLKLDKIVAVKVLLPPPAGRDGAIERLIREARLIAKLDHPNIVQILDVDHAAGLYYIIMQYVGGMSLSRLLKRQKRLSAGHVMRIMRGVAEGLAEAHAQGIIHRDIKTDNILLDHRGNPKIVDFGLARALETKTALTRQGHILGSPLFMAPEQASGKVMDARTDLYSLGITGYCLVTGEPPFRAPSAVALIVKQIKEPAPDPVVLAPETPNCLRAILFRLMEKDPGARFQSAGELIDALDDCLQKISG